MWKAITLVGATAVFSIIGLSVTFNQPTSDRVLGALLGGVCGFIIGYLSIVIAISSDRPK